MKKIIIIFGLLLILVPIKTSADGMIVPMPDYYMYESDQRAVILYEGGTQTETMVLSVKFQGNAKDFAWIIPVPNQPEITKGSDTLFTAVSELTQGNYYNYYGASELGLGSTRNVTQDVSVVETKKVDYYDITTLTSTDSQALVKWLNDNGYPYPAGSEYIFNSYITNNWYFVALKIDTTALAGTAATTDLREGHATPLKLTFKAKNLVYPLKISSVVTESITKKTNTNTNNNLNTNSPYILEDTSTGPAVDSAIYPYYPSQVSVELYILADHKKTLANFTTAYGNWVKKSVIEDWAANDQGDPLLSPSRDKYFLTKLTRQMTYFQMSEDLFPRDASDNKKVISGSQYDWLNLEVILMFLLAVSLYTVFIFAIGIFSPLGLAFVIFTLVQFKAKSRAWRIIAWIVQIGVTAVYYLVAAVIILAFLGSPYGLAELPRSLISGGYSSSEFLSSDSLIWLFTFLLPLAVFLALPVLTLVWQSRYRKNRALKPAAINNLNKK
ncbi:MAG: DUF2330 domain-containing protein [Patescibacteria group bacterium]